MIFMICVYWLFLYLCVSKEIGENSKNDEISAGNKDKERYQSKNNPPSTDNVPREVDQPLEDENKSVTDVYLDVPPAIISEIDKLAVEYSSYLQDSFLLTSFIFLIGTYLLFLGKMTKRLSLSFIMSIFIFHYIEKINDAESIGLWPLNKIIGFIKGVIDNTSHPYITILIISTVFSLIFTYLIGALRLFLGLAATYFFYTTYVESLVSFNDDYQRYVFVFTAVLVFLLIYFLFERAVNTIYVLLFSLTGSLIVYMTVEKVFGFDWKLTKILVTMREDYEAMFPSFMSMTFFVLTMLGVYIQIFYVGSIIHC